MNTLSVDDLVINQTSEDLSTNCSKKDLNVLHKSLKSSKSSPLLNESFNKRRSNLNSPKLFKNISRDYLNSPPYMNPHKALIDLYRKFSTKKGSSQTNSFDVKKRKIKKQEDIYNYCNKENTFIVTLRKNNRGLGMSIYGGIDVTKDNPFSQLIRILNLHPLQPALECRKLALGDVILEVNGTSMLGITKSDAIDVLRNAPADVVLKIFRPPKCFVPSFSAFKESLSGYSSSSGNLTGSSVRNSPFFDKSGTFEVTLVKQDGCLGFTIVYKDGTEDETAGIYIKSLTRKHAVAHGRIQPGDRILQVNGTNVSDFSQNEALTCLRNADTIVDLKLYRPKKLRDSNKKVHTFNAILKTSRNDSLGFSLCDSSNGQIFASPLPCAPELETVKFRSSADENGIKVGDRILEVNGENLINKTTSEATKIINQLDGIIRMVCCRLQDGSKDALSNEREVQTFNINLKTSRNESLGFSVWDSNNNSHISSPFYPWAPEIKTIYPDGLADKNGIELGDRILEVNGESLIYKSAFDANNIIRQTDGDIKMVCCRMQQENKDTSSKMHTFNVVLKTCCNDNLDFAARDSDDSRQISETFLPCVSENKLNPDGLEIIETELGDKI